MEPVPGIVDQTNLSQATKDIIKTLQKIVLTHALIHEGTYAGKSSKLIVDAVDFLEKLHASNLELLKAQPDYDNVPETMKG